MGLLHKACETYDCHVSLVGLPQAEKETLAPVSTFSPPRRLRLPWIKMGNFRTPERWTKVNRKL